MEPYAYSQMIAGRDGVHHGEAKNSWLTGTAAWNYVAIAHYMLGVRPELDGLRVQPCIDKMISEFTITRHCRGAEYIIHVKNLQTGTVKLTVNGKPIDGTVVPYAKPGEKVVVECET